MAKKAAPKKSPAPTVPAAAPAPASMIPASVESPIAESAVRKTVTPKAAPVAKKAPAPMTHDRIAERAYLISRSGYGGSEYDNWLRAEAELKGEGV